MPEPRYEYVRIGLPLPLSVIGPLGDLMDKAWPDATIITDPARAGVPWEVQQNYRSGELLIRVDVSKAARRVTKKAAREHVDAAVAAAEETEVGFGGFTADGTLKLSPPEELTQALAPIIEQIMDMDGVVNYMSWEVTGRPDGRLAGTSAFVSVSRSKGQTTHQLRMKAEAAHKETIRADLAVFERVGCQFFACEGPDEPPVDMATCYVCNRIRELRVELADAQPSGEDQVEATR